LAWSSGTGAVGALIVGVAALIRDQPVPGVAALAILAIPLLLVGQVWSMALAIARMPRFVGGWREDARARRRLGIRLIFGDLSRGVVWCLSAVFFLGWFFGVSAWAALSEGGPAGAGADCPYRLNNHGSYTCVSRETYQHVGAADQRFACGVMLAFFAMHTGAALGGLHRRRTVGEAAGRTTDV
jgi:hypothetical protein